MYLIVKSLAKLIPPTRFQDLIKGVIPKSVIVGMATGVFIGDSSVRGPAVELMVEKLMNSAVSQR